MEVNGLWISESNELPIMAVMSINSYIKHGHTFVLWSYCPNYVNLPTNCILRDANEIIPWSESYKDILESYAHFQVFGVGNFYMNMVVSGLIWM